MINSDVAENMGVIETVQDSLPSESAANAFGVDKNLVLDVAVYGAIGFIAGFLLKKYSEYCISLVLLVIALIVLQQFDYIAVSLNSVKIHNALGLQGVPMMGDAYWALLWEWIRTHMISAVSMLVGFLIGLKVA